MNHPRIVRALRIIGTAICGIACVLLIALWLRSYYTFDRLSGQVANRTSVILVSYAGRLTFVTTGLLNLRWNWPQWGRGPILPNNATDADLPVDWNNTDIIWPDRGFMGFGWMYNTSYCNIPNSESGWNASGMSGRSWAANATGFMMPHWFAVVVAGSLAGPLWLRWRFSLRTLLIATTIIAVVLGLSLWAVH